jgi:glycosyltransferase involved in cell wall biosynthesis
VDDHSSDHSYALTCEEAKKDPRIICLQTEKNCGSSGARNLGLRKAQGRYICFLDSDDMLKPDFLEKQLAFAGEKGPFVFASYDRLAPNSTTTFHVRKEVSAVDLMKGNDISCLTAFYDSQELGKPLFDETLGMNEDVLYWITLIKATKDQKAFGNPESLAIYRIVKNSKSKKKGRSARWLYVIYHKRLGVSWLRSWHYILHVTLYSLRKYKNVK